MPLVPGSRFGAYDVVSLIGVGGMGEVYRATDSRLHRAVALKVLPETIANDPDRVARFAREAQLLASLNHPHIAAIYGIEQSGAVQALVLELVDGTTLADRITRGAIPLEEALPIARQIADALDAAHEKGIIHRDLKPANVALAADGTVKVLDFGVAKVLDTWSGDAESPPTMTATNPGTVVGTAAYMSPEQATGKSVDRASDLWAFGCVLYEMLTRQRAFDGSTASEAVAAVLRAEPEWQRLPADVPESIRRLLRRCLEKDPKRRLRDIRDARLEIDDAGRPASTTAPARDAGRYRRERLAWAIALAVVTALAAALGVWALRPVAIPPEMRFEVSGAPSVDPTVAISPDGLRIVYAGRSADRSGLWLRELGSSSPQLIPGTERGVQPFWSPDSRSIGFFDTSALMRIDLADGSVRPLVAPAPAPLGGAWNADEIILFAAHPGAPIMRVSANGGAATAATAFDASQRSQSSPRFLRDGRHFLFFVIGSPEVRGVHVGELGTLETRRLFDADAPAVQTAAGPLLFVRQGKLWAQDFDMATLALQGDPVPVEAALTAGASLSASAAGPIVYRTLPADSGQRKFTWIDRSGTIVNEVRYPDTVPGGPVLSPDGKRLAIYRLAGGNMDIWSYGIEQGTWDRLTFDAGDDINPLWSPDGTHLIFGSRRAGRMDLFRKRLNGPPSNEELLLSSPDIKFPIDWSHDGRFLLYNVVGASRGADIWALPLAGGSGPLSLVSSDYDELLPQFAPNGKWFAYQSNRTGRHEIYLRPFPGPGNDLLVSPRGGIEPRWNANGTELFYLEPEARLMSVGIRVTPDGNDVQLDRPKELFAGPIQAFPLARHQYVVSPDGQSFVANTGVSAGAAMPISVILNWRPPGR